MLFRLAQLADHLYAGEAAAADRKSQETLSLNRVVFIRSTLKHVLHMRAELDRVLIRPEGMRVFRGALDAEEIRLAADREDQIIKIIRTLCARDMMIGDVALGDFIGDHVDLAAAEDLAKIDLDGIRFGTMSGYLV